MLVFLLPSSFTGVQNACVINVLRIEGNPVLGNRKDSGQVVALLWTRCTDIATELITFKSSFVGVNGTYY